MNIDTLLQKSAEKAPLSTDFVQKVQKRIQLRTAKKRRQKLLYNTLLLSSAFVVFYYALTVCILHLIAAQSFDFFNVLLHQPSLLALADARSALFEVLPFANLILLGVTVGFCIKFARNIVQDLNAFMPFSSRYVAQ